MQRDMHPTLLSSLEGIVDQMVWFRENWHEEVEDCLIYCKGVWLEVALVKLAGLTRGKLELAVIVVNSISQN